MTTTKDSNDPPRRLQPDVTLVGLARQSRGLGDLSAVATVSNVEHRPMSTRDDCPGRQIPDSRRSPRGLGWEYRRRKWSPSRCPFTDPEDRAEFMYGYEHFVCSNPDVDEAMLTRGVPIE